MATRTQTQTALGSRNPFRNGAADRIRSSVYSPFSDDDGSDYFSGTPPLRSHSVGTPEPDFARPYSYAGSDENLSTSLPMPRANERFARRQYVTGSSSSSRRKSTNPFLPDEMRTPPPPPVRRESDSATTTRSRPAPPRPSTSTKPSRSPPTELPPSYEESSTNREKLLKPEKDESSSTSRSRSTDDRPHREQREHREHRDRSERSERHRDRSERSGDKTKRRSKKKVHTDAIDKLDVTGIFGPGSFHHDGPFDACNPSRNKNKQRAPVMAFPADGANMTITAVDSTHDKYETENRILNRGDDEAYQDFSIGKRNTSSNSAVSNTNTQPAAVAPEDEYSWDTSKKATPIHGDTTVGLGSSTFLDGAPAPRSAVTSANVSSLGRKKSLVQRLRGSGNSVPPPQPPRNYEPIARTTSNTTDNRSDGPTKNELLAVPRQEQAAPVEQPSGGNGLLRRVKSLKVGSRRRGS